LFSPSLLCAPSTWNEEAGNPGSPWLIGYQALASSPWKHDSSVEDRETLISLFFKVFISQNNVLSKKKNLFTDTITLCSIVYAAKFYSLDPNKTLYFFKANITRSSIIK
jgi:hypothetical protein